MGSGEVIFNPGPVSNGQKTWQNKQVFGHGFASSPPYVTTPNGGTASSSAGTYTFTNTSGYDVQVYMASTTGVTIGTVTVNGVVLPGTVPVGQIFDLYVPAGQTFGYTTTGSANITWAWLAV